MLSYFIYQNAPAVLDGSLLFLRIQTPTHTFYKRGKRYIRLQSCDRDHNKQTSSLN